MSRSAKLIISLQRSKDPGVHLPHCLLCVNRDRPVGGLDHLQDQEELSVPAGDEERDAQLWALLRNPAGRFSVLLPRHGQGAQDVSSEGNSKALSLTFGLLRRGIKKRLFFFQKNSEILRPHPPPLSNSEAPVFSDKEISELARPPPLLAKNSKIFSVFF